jgi:transketolase
MNNLSQRDTFWNKIYEIALHDKNIVIITADMGAPALDKIRHELASQFVNVGIAEQNAITLASGLALSGKRVFTYAIAPFITMRCLEQIRVNNAMMKVPITIVGVGAGFGYEDSGPTHHLIEDIAIIRSMPNVAIHSITDGVMAAACAENSCSISHANYVRIDRQVLPDLYKAGTDFTQGINILRPGKDMAIISTGTMAHAAIKAAEELALNGLDIRVIDLHTFPVNSPNLLEALNGISKVATVEEHFLQGGLGSAVCEVLADNGMLIPIKRLGLPHEKSYCYEYGGREAIRGYYGMDYGSMITNLRQFFV